MGVLKIYDSFSHILGPSILNKTNIDQSLKSCLFRDLMIATPLFTRPYFSRPLVNYLFALIFAFIFYVFKRVLPVFLVATVGGSMEFGAFILFEYRTSKIGFPFWEGWQNQVIRGEDQIK